jgi:hypothetical protein
MPPPTLVGFCENLQTDVRFDVCHWHPDVARALAEGLTHVDVKFKRLPTVSYTVGAGLHDALSATHTLEAVPWRDEFTEVALVPHACTRGKDHGILNLRKLACAVGLPPATPRASFAFKSHRAGNAASNHDKIARVEFQKWGFALPPLS